MFLIECETYCFGYSGEILAAREHLGSTPSAGVPVLQVWGNQVQLLCGW